MNSTFKQNEKEIKSFLKHIDNRVVRAILASSGKEIILATWDVNYCDYCYLQAMLIIDHTGIWIKCGKYYNERIAHVDLLINTLSNSGYNRESLRNKFFADLKRIVKDKVSDVCCDTIRKILK